MSLSERQIAPQFTQPVRQIVTMLAITGIVGAGAWLAFPQVAPVFLSNPWLNGGIFAVFLVGVLACFLQVFQLVNCVSWIEGFARGRPGASFAVPPRLLAPLATLLRKSGAKTQLSASSTRSILDSVATRIEEARDITRYLVNLLIFLGLLGTFYGLATTVPAVVDTIRSLAPQEGEQGVAVFDRLMTGLEAQLGGMGTAFSSSLIGLAGSLVVGLLELFAGHGQNRFYRELEEWLSSMTRIGISAGDGDGVGDGVGAALVQLAEQIDSLSVIYNRSDESRGRLEAQVAHLAEGLGRVASRLEAEAGAARSTQDILARIAEGQERVAALLSEQRPREDTSADAAGGDAESRMRLRSIDVQLLRILEELSVGRQESLADLRADLAQLTRAVRQLGAGTTAEGGRRRM